MLIMSQYYVRDRDHMYDCDLSLDKLYSFHQAKNILLRFKARVIKRRTTKLLDCRSQCGLTPSSLSPLLK
jgi:hypothetical protein